MRRTNYDSNTFPLLAEKYARKGLTDQQIAANLGIGYSTYFEYQNRYPEFKEAIKRGKAPVDVVAENALYKRAIGYDYEEVSTEVAIGVDGFEITPTRVKTVRKHIPPDVVALQFWLKNRLPADWREKSQQEITGKDGMPLLQPVDMAKLSHDEKTKLLELARKVGAGR